MQNYFPDGCIADAVLMCECSSRNAGCRCRPNRENVYRRQFGSRIASFTVHVPHVRGSGAQEEMGRIHAGRVVAPMADVQAIRDGAVVDFPGHTARWHRVTVDVRPDLAVPLVVARSGPFPAGVSRSLCRDVLPEAVGVRSGALTGHRAEPLAALLDVAPLGIERHATRRARQVGTITAHQAHSLVSGPGCDQHAGATSCLDFTMPDQITEAHV